LRQKGAKKEQRLPHQKTVSTCLGDQFKSKRLRRRNINSATLLTNPNEAQTAGLRPYRVLATFKWMENRVAALQLTAARFGEATFVLAIVSVELA